jgi:hypothetical protein
LLVSLPSPERFANLRLGYFGTMAMKNPGNRTKDEITKVPCQSGCGKTLDTMLMFQVPANSGK